MGQSVSGGGGGGAIFNCESIDYLKSQTTTNDGWMTLIDQSFPGRQFPIS